MPSLLHSFAPPRSNPRELVVGPSTSIQIQPGNHCHARRARRQRQIGKRRRCIGDSTTGTTYTTSQQAHEKRTSQPLPAAPYHRHTPWAATTFPRSACTSTQPNSWSQRHWQHRLHGTAQSARSRPQPAWSVRSSSVLKKPARNHPSFSAQSKSPTRRTGSDGNTSTTTLGNWRGLE